MQLREFLRTIPSPGRYGFIQGRYILEVQEAQEAQDGYDVLLAGEHGETAAIWQHLPATEPVQLGNAPDWLGRHPM